MTASAGATAPRSTRPGRRPRGFGSLLLAFLLGVLFTAAAAVTLLMLDVLGDDDGAAEAAPSAAAEQPATDEGATEGEAASGDVPPACVEAAEYNQTFTEALDEIALGARDQDARRLQEALDAVQDAQPGSEAASQECRELAGEGGTGADDQESSSEDDTSDSDTDPDSSESSPEPSPGEPTATPAP